ncbi:PDDEXK-like family protein [Phocaeicola vulgatus]|jgi:hypothetical protein|uniref:PDDEXK-like family protein n=1 Tax=Phocaeicola vulgatus TaxID=821 RepID=UPI001F285581|nr:PD-(D/E)XK nuclease family protein [Phocaeicola vulgatus]MCG0156492.1 PD-(D/E)XK nuclease family protein [Phocaeicola vulgatus]MCG0330378.1 PD-(D/E)XK nuclease family protein [Phocaeicola vulgatus]MCG0334295.1 PD-(D/E)XK nuclease family protein [Phocaeicola vulgatus]
MNSLIQLFHEIHLLLEKHEQIRKEKGDNYNLFQVINMTSDETRVHSAMIADLLNPKGKHQMGDVFLRLFIHCLKTQQLNHELSFTYNKAKVECEKYIGPKMEKSGGRLDIYLTDGVNHIIIENKIYAADQKNQLLRYHNFLKHYPDNHTLLLYLSLDGEVHDMDKTTNGEKVKFITISYTDFILNWLTECRYMAIDRPLIREGITHYRNLIKILTHQMDNEKNDLINLIRDNQRYINYIPQYKDAIREVEIGLQKDFWRKLEWAFEEAGYGVIKKSFGNYKYALDRNKDYIRKYYENNNCKYQSIEFELEKIGDYQLMYAVQVDWRTYSGILLRDKDGQLFKPEDAIKIKNGKLQEVITRIERIIKDSPDRFHSSSNWLLWKYTNPTINFRNLDDKDSALHLSNMEKTIKSITEDTQDNINMIWNKEWI